jgi:hypothetical protein
MSFLAYRGSEEYFDVELPSRVFAFVDRLEPEFALLDSLDADWLEGNRRTPWLGASEVSEDVERRLSALEVPTDTLEKLQECDWLEVNLDDEPGGVRVDQYFNLFEGPRERRVTSITPTTSEMTNLLARVSGLDAITDASAEDVIGELQSLLYREVSAAAVYDVGQGGCNALISDERLPLLYFDFGGGVQANRSTYALADRAFCFTVDPPVVLSHWDWDHWSSAQRDPRAHDVTWIAPRQPIGPANARFAGKLKHLLLWAGHEPLRLGPVLLEHCSGASRNRNESGIAMLLHDPDSDGRMLFPGDAGYANVPSATGTFTSIVLPHHGGATGGGTVVDPDGSAHGRLVCSAGPCNSYGHPSPSVMRAHKAWTKRRCTMDRRNDGLGHVHLYWSEATPAIVTPCGGSGCQLESHQR